MVEGVVVFPVILIFFGLLANAHNRQQERFKANLEGRHDAFRRAVLGCPETFGPDTRHPGGSVGADNGAGFGVKRAPGGAIVHPETQRNYLALNEPFDTSYYAVYQSSGVFSKVYCNAVVSNPSQFPHPSDTLADWYQFATRTYISAFEP